MALLAAIKITIIILTVLYMDDPKHWLTAARRLK